MTPSEFKALLPEFTNETDIRIQLLLDRSVPYFDVARWGSFYNDGVMYWVAHEITLANLMASKGGPVKAAKTMDVVRKRVGEIDVMRDSSLVNKGAENQYLRTEYGQRFLQLRRLAGMGAVTV